MPQLTLKLLNTEIVLFPLVFMAQLVRPMTMLTSLLFPALAWFLTLGTARTLPM